MAIGNGHLDRVPTHTHILGYSIRGCGYKVSDMIQMDCIYENGYLNYMILIPNIFIGGMLILKNILNQSTRRR